MYYIKTTLALAAIACLIYFNIAVIPKTPTEVARNKFDRIKIGMPKGEVEAILHGTPGNYFRDRYPGSRKLDDAEVWVVDEIAVAFVFFDKNGLVIDKEWFELGAC